MNFLRLFLISFFLLSFSLLAVDVPKGVQEYERGVLLKNQNQLLPALKCFYRAHILNPNSSFINQELQSTSAVLGVSLLSSWKEKINSRISPHLLFLFGSGLGWLAALFVAWILFSKKVSTLKYSTKKLISLAIGVFILGHLIAAFSMIIDPRFYSRHQRFLLPTQKSSIANSATDSFPTSSLSSISLYKEPTLDSPILAQLSAGSLVELEMIEKDWSLIKVDSQKKGWIPSSALESLF